MLFYVDFSYENLPDLCSFCHVVGHSIGICRRAKAVAAKTNSNEHPPVDRWDNDKGKETAVDSVPPQHPKKQWVVKAPPSRQEGSQAGSGEQDSAKASSSHKEASAIVLANKYAALQETVNDLEKFASLSPFDKLEMITVQISPDINEISQKDLVPDNLEESQPRKVVLVDPVITYAPLSPIPNELSEENTMRLARRVAKMAGKATEDLISQSTSQPAPPLKGSELVHSSLTQAYNRGATPTAYSLEPDGNSNVMTRVANRRWSDEVEAHITNSGSLDPLGESS